MKRDDQHIHNFFLFLLASWVAVIAVATLLSWRYGWERGPVEILLIGAIPFGVGAAMVLAIVAAALVCALWRKK